MTASRLFRSRGVRDDGRRSNASDRDQSHVLPIAGATSLALDTDLLRQRLGAWIATQTLAERPSVEVLWRESTVVCDGVIALARATLGAGGSPLWLVDVHVSYEARELADWTGLPPRSIRPVVEALIGAEVLDGVAQVGRERVVRVRPDILVDAPVLAAIEWGTVREQLGDTDSPVARLVIRELARRTTTEARQQGHFISLSQRELAEAVGYSKASMRRHLDLLTAAGVIVSRSRDRANSWHRLEPVVFGEGDVTRSRRGASARIAPDPAVMHPSDVAAEDRPRLQSAKENESRAVTATARPVLHAAGASPEGPVVSRPLGSEAHRGTATTTTPGVAARVVTSALTLEVNGVRVALPPGVELTLEQDASGAFWYCAGALRLGPVQFG